MGSLACVDLLLRSPLHSPELTLQAERNGWTPFLYAIYREQIPCAMRLLQRHTVHTSINSNSSWNANGSDEGPSETAVLSQSLFDRYDYDNALSQLLLLGRIVQLCSRGDDRVRAAMETLSTVPEFRQVVNAVLRAHIDRVDEELGFLLLHPSLLDVESKLLVLKKACLQLHHTAIDTSLKLANDMQWNSSFSSSLSSSLSTDELEVGALFPLLVRRPSRDHTPKQDVKLPRQNPWRGLVDILRRISAAKSK